MKKFTKLLLFTVVSGLLFPFYQSIAQSFTEISAGLPGVAYSSVAWVDYDNDDDLDILLTGYIDGYDDISKIYRNDGAGTFTEINSGMIPFGFGSIALGDYNRMTETLIYF